MLWGKMSNIKYFIIKVPNIKAILYLPLSMAPQKKGTPALRKSKNEMKIQSPPAWASLHSVQLHRLLLSYFLPGKT